MVFFKKAICGIILSNYEHKHRKKTENTIFTYFPVFRSRDETLSACFYNWFLRLKPSNIYFVFTAMPTVGHWWLIHKDRPTSGWKTWKKRTIYTWLKWRTPITSGHWKTVFSLELQWVILRTDKSIVYLSRLKPVLFLCCECLRCAFTCFLF